MSHSATSKRINRQRRHARIRAKVSGTAQKPRVAVFRSSQHITAQAVDDVARRTIVSVSDTAGKGTKTERALDAGKRLAKLLKGAGVETVVFDKGGFTYHGRVKAVADGLREGGITV